MLNLTITIDGPQGAGKTFASDKITAGCPSVRLDVSPAVHDEAVDAEWLMAAVDEAVAELKTLGTLDAFFVVEGIGGHLPSTRHRAKTLIRAWVPGWASVIFEEQGW